MKHKKSYINVVTVVPYVSSVNVLHPERSHVNTKTSLNQTSLQWRKIWDWVLFRKCDGGSFNRDCDDDDDDDELRYGLFTLERMRTCLLQYVDAQPIFSF